MQHDRHISTKAKLAFLTAIFLWASAFVAIRTGLHGYSPGGLAELRFLVAGAFMLLIRPFLGATPRIIWSDRLRLMLIGTLGLGIYNLALNTGELAVPSGIASFIISQTPVVTLILAVLFLGELPGKRMLSGMLVSVSGIALIALGQVLSFSLNMGVFYVLVATVAGSIYSVAQKPLLKKYDAIEATVWVILGAAVILLPYTAKMLVEMHTATASATFSAIYLGIFPAALGYIAWSVGLKEVPASVAANTMYFLPVVTTFLGWLILGEIPAVLSLIGGIIALAGVWIVNHRGTGKRYAKPHSADVNIQSAIARDTGSHN